MSLNIKHEMFVCARYHTCDVHTLTSREERRNVLGHCELDIIELIKFEVL